MISLRADGANLSENQKIFQKISVFFNLPIDKCFFLWYYIRAVLKETEIRGCSSMVEVQPSKLVAWVRFPSPAP